MRKLSLLSLGKLGVMGIAALSAADVASAAGAGSLAYVPLALPCRLLDTRNPASVGLLSSTAGNYQFGTSDVAVASAYQSGNPAGCGVPPSAVAISANLNMINTSASGHIDLWSTASGPTPPIAGTAVYNPSVPVPMPGQVEYNPGYATFTVNPADGTFYLDVSNGTIGVVVNAVGYWLPLSATPAGGMTFIASASALTPTTVAGGLVGTQPVMPVSGSILTSAPIATVNGSQIDLSSLLGVAQVFPRSGSFGTIKGDFVNTLGLSLVSSSLTLTATLYTAPAGSLLASSTGLSCSVTYTGNVTIGTVNTCTPSGNASVNAGDKGIIVFSATASGASLVNTAVIGATIGISP